MEKRGGQAWLGAFPYHLSSLRPDTVLGTRQKRLVDNPATFLEGQELF